MKFKHSCFTENTPENREWLESLGYKIIGRLHSTLIVTVIEDGYGFITNTFEEDLDNEFYSNAIDCRSNPSLFKAVSAVREGSDYMQWFTDGKDWLLWDSKNRPQIDMYNYSEESEDAREVGIYDGIHKDYVAYNPYHKATLSELIEHFGNSEQLGIDKNLAIKK